MVSVRQQQEKIFVCMKCNKTMCVCGGSDVRRDERPKEKTTKIVECADIHRDKDILQQNRKWCAVLTSGLTTGIPTDQSASQMPGQPNKPANTGSNVSVRLTILPVKFMTSNEIKQPHQIN